MSRFRLHLALAVLALFTLSTAAAQAVKGSLSVTIYADGSALVTIKAETGGAPLVELEAIGSPDPSLGIVAFNERNELLPTSYDSASGLITVLAFNSSTVTVSYVTATLTTKVRDLWFVNFSAPLPATVELPPNATLSGIYTDFTSIKAEGGRVVVQFPPGPVMLSYTLLQPLRPRPPPPGNQTQQPATPPPSQPSGPAQPSPGTPTQQPSPAQPQQVDWLLVALLGVALAAAAAAALILRGRRKEGLSETDMEIIRALQAAGGGMFQSELAARLSIPTTTLWRRLRKLQELGYIVIERRGGRNYVRLT
ncbi:MAG: winged helix-turn-helix transcriptional regulator [Thermofilum sp.]